MSRVAHPAGPRHGDVLPADHPPAAPEDLNELHEEIWPRGARRSGGVLTLGGVDVRDLAAEFGTPLYVCDETGRPVALPRVPGGVRAGRAGVLRGQGVLLPGRAALGERGGPRRRRVHRRRARGGAVRRGAAGADHHARQQQDAGRAGPRGRGRRGPHRGRLLRGDRPAGLPDRGCPGPPQDPGPRHHRGGGAHPRVHGDRARRPEVRLLAGLGRRRRGGPAGHRLPGPVVRRAALAHRLADLRHGRLRGGRAPGGRAGRPDQRTSTASRSPNSTWAAGSASPTPTRTTPPRSRISRRACARSWTGSAGPPGWPGRG